MTFELHNQGLGSTTFLREIRKVPCEPHSRSIQARGEGGEKRNARNVASGGQLCLPFGVAKEEQEVKYPRDPIREFASPENAMAATTGDLR